MQQRFWGRWNIRAGVGTFLILTHLLAGVAALTVASAAQRGNAAPWLVAVLALAAACETGWIVTLELRRIFNRQNLRCNGSWTASPLQKFHLVHAGRSPS